MIDKRFILAIALSIVILVGWQYLFPPPKPVPASPVPSPVAEASPLPSSAVVPAAAPPVAPAAAPAAAQVGAAAPEDVTVETDHVIAVLTNRGARVASWRLKEYSGFGNRPVELVPAPAKLADRLPLAVDLDNADLARRINEALFEVTRDSTAAEETLRFVWADGQGAEVVKTVVFRKADWLVDVDVKVREQGRPVPARLVWGPGFEADDNGGAAIPMSGTHYVSQAVLRQGPELPNRVPPNKVDQPFAIPPEAPLRWAGLEETYFAALFVPDSGRGGAVVRSELLPANPADPKAEPQKSLTVAVGIPDGGAKLFVGPKKYSLLTQLGHDLSWVVFFSSYPLIYWLAQGLFLALTWIHDHVFANYGVAIILATIGLRLAFFPLNQYSMVKMRRVAGQMQRIQPKIKAIQAKYKKGKDSEGRMKMNEEMMALYKREGVNPFGGMSGCLPMLIQLPVLYAFYNVLVVTVELRGAPFFGWIHDLTLKDPFYVTPLMMGATMFIQQKMTPAAGVDPAQQRMMLMMPIVFTVMFLNLPSGLVLYWFVNNLLGIGQQWLVNRHIARLEAASQGA